MNEKGYSCHVDLPQLINEMKGSTTLILSPSIIDGLEHLDYVVQGDEVCSSVKELSPESSEGEKDVLCAVIEQQFCADSSDSKFVKTIKYGVIRSIS